MTEQLTDEERECLVLQDGGVTGSNARKALRIIDAHAADRAALVAQLEAAEHDTSNARWEMARMQGELNRFEMRASEWALDDAKRRNAIADLNSQLAELTRERDEARKRVTELEEDASGLTEALAAARASRGHRLNEELRGEVTRLTEALAAAEARLRLSTDAEYQSELAKGLRSVCRDLDQVSDRCAAAEARVLELEERVSQALTGLRPGSPVREALEEALRAP